MQGLGWKDIALYGSAVIYSRSRIAVTEVLFKLPSRSLEQDILR